MKLSKRLQTIANFIEDKDKFVDVGADHGYLDIYIALNKKNDTIIASDISKDVIKTTINNIKKYKLENKIKVYCTNGTNNIKENYDTIIIAGMGSNNIINIIKNSNRVRKLIISSNNNWNNIRKEISLLGYYLKSERLVKDGKKLYSIMLFNKGYKKISKKEISIGKYNDLNKEEYELLYEDIKNTYNQVPRKKIIKRIFYKKQMRYLKSYLRKKDR